MGALDDLKTRIDEAIYQNTQQKITGEVLQDTLEDMVDTMGVSVSQNTLTIGGEDKAALPDSWENENPEWVKVVTDSEDKILYGIKTDGKFYFGDGCPPQVVEYITNYVGEKLGSFNAEDYADIKTFLGSLIDGDTLETLLNGKVDKVIGKSLIDSEFATSQQVVTNPEYLQVTTDSEEKILEGFKTDGTKVIEGDLEIKGKIINRNSPEEQGLETEKISIDGNVIENIQDPEGRSEIKTDAEGRILAFRDSEGKVVENVGVVANTGIFNHLMLTESGMSEFQQALKDAGFNPGGTGDWSDYMSNDGDNPLCIPQPKGIAMVNILSDVNLSALTKETTPGAVEGVTYDVHAQIEFWDMNGNYFKKPVLMSGQGNSSMAYPKKNIALDIFDSEIDGDAFKVKFGNWVPQDSWHLKAYYTDAFRCIGLATYKWYDEIVKTRGIKSDYVYKKALIDFSKIGYVANGYNDLSDISLQYETGAKCFPDGFPIIIYQNGNFWGLFCWQIKKHRDNYHMKKSNKKHIHLDGTLNATTFFNGYINWEEFEVRNPKDLIDMDGKKYNGDIPKELIDSTSQYYDSTNAKHVNTAAVKQYIINFSNVMSELNTAEATYNASSKTAEDLATLKAVFETYFDVENLIDYLIVSDVSRNYDGFSKNWQWVTYNGVKWYCCLYDCDGCFGGNFTGTSTMLPLSGGHISTSLMNHFIVTYYNSELNTRYAELRNNKVVSTDAIIRIIDDLMLKFGTQNISKEFDKWTNCPCNRDTVVNENWEFDLDENGNPQLGIANYNNSTTYNVGDSCFYAQYPGNGEAVYKYKAKATVTGIKPVDSFGYRDSIYRLYNWIVKAIENMDSVYNYTNN